MDVENLVQELEYNYNKGFDNEKIIENCVNLINQIFVQIKSDDEFCNLFLKQLNVDFINYFTNIAKDSLNKKKFIKKNSDTLIKQKYSKLILDKEIIREIERLTKKELELLKKKEFENKVSRSDLTISGGFKILRLINILNKEFTKIGHLDSVSNYLGYESEVTGLAIELSSEKSTWWKHKKNTLENKTLAVHLDKDFNCIKSILYLTEVKSDNGPFTIYPKIYEDLKLNIFQDIFGRMIHETATNAKDEKLKKYLNIKDNNQPFLSENLQKIYSKLPKIITFNSCFGWELESGSDLEKKIVNNKNEIHGVPGTRITFDGSRLLHSGGLVKAKSRLALQIVYSKKINVISKYINKIKNKLTLKTKLVY